MNPSIRRAQPEDYMAVHEIFCGRSLINGTMRLPYASPTDIQKRLELREDRIQLVSLVEKEDEEKIVGFAEMLTFPNTPRHNHVGEINLVAVREGWQSQGVGRQLMNTLLELADDWLQLRRLGLLVWTDNERAIQLYKHMGFTIEGTLHEYAFRAGCYIDAHIMGRLSPKFRDNRHELLAERIANGRRMTRYEHIS